MKTVKTMPAAKAKKMVTAAISEATASVLVRSDGIPADWDAEKVRWHVVDAIRDAGMYKVGDLAKRREYVQEKKEYGL